MHHVAVNGSNTAPYGGGLRYQYGVTPFRDFGAEGRRSHSHDTGKQIFGPKQPLSA